MTKMNRWLTTVGMAAAMCLVATQGLAQPNDNNNQGRRGRGNFDPAQMRERMMENLKEQMEVKDDAEWKAIEPLVAKVMEARMASFGGMGRGMFRRPGGNDNAGDQGPRRGPGGFGQPNPDAEALQKAVDAKASNSELKAALAKYQDSRKAKQVDLEKAQADLRKVLTVRQEAVATLNGLL